MKRSKSDRAEYREARLGALIILIPSAIVIAITLTTLHLFFESYLWIGLIALVVIGSFSLIPLHILLDTRHWVEGDHRKVDWY